jgi:hypothetical protein
VTRNDDDDDDDDDNNNNNNNNNMSNLVMTSLNLQIRKQQAMSNYLVCIKYYEPEDVLLFALS